MNITNWMKKSLALTGALVALAGCQKNDGSTQVSSRISAYGPRAASSAGYSVAGTSLAGRVYFDASGQQGFEEAVKDFLSTDVLWNYVGYVSATGQYNTGVYFGGQVAPVTGSLRTLSGGTVAIASNSRLVIQVIDSWPQAPNTPVLPPFIFNRADGYISGNTAQITFSDNYGSITFSGYINTSTNRFEGNSYDSVRFDNTENINPSDSPHAGNLGGFSIPLCSFFVCN